MKLLDQISDKNKHSLLFNEMSKKGEIATEQRISYHYEHENILFRIVHEENLKEKTEVNPHLLEQLVSPYNTVYTTWNVLRKPTFTWKIHRTKKNNGEDKFETKCPYCGTKFEAGLESFESIALNERNNKILKNASRIIAPIVLITAIIGFFISNMPDWFGVIWICSILGLFPVGLCTLLVHADQRNLCGYFKGFDEHPQSYYNLPRRQGTDHYLERIESY